MKPVFKYYSSK